MGVVHLNRKLVHIDTNYAVTPTQFISIHVMVGNCVIIQ